MFTPTRFSLFACFVLAFQFNILADDKEWLEKGLPPIAEDGAKFTIKKVEITRNHVDQEISKVEFERTPEIYRTLAREVKVVILPAGGGRHEVWAPNGITAGPAQSGTITGIQDGSIDYRGKIPGGARAYMEMSVASIAKKQPPVRISNVIWIGSADELKTAQKAGDPVDPADKEKQAVAVKTVADDDALPAGMPVKFAGGSRWFNATLVEKSAAGQPLKLVVYFAKPGGLYLPWYVTANRDDAKVEAAALEASKKDATWFADHAREIKGRISQGSAPFTLKAVGEKVMKGDRVVWFGFHGLTGAEAIEDSADGKVKVKDKPFNQEHTLEVGQLFVDAEPVKK